MVRDSGKQWCREHAPSVSRCRHEAVGNGGERREAMADNGKWSGKCGEVGSSWKWSEVVETGSNRCGTV
eukprot:11394033-Alexandrium_andersonii.AAC.1